MTKILESFLELYPIHPSWHDDLVVCLAEIHPDFLAYLANNNHYLPANHQLFQVFSRSKAELRVILLGESPYPRQQSANGFAFWDANVDQIWSDKGLSKTVNRATSLRNLIKMLLRAEGLLSQGFSTQDIAKIDKQTLCQNLDDVFLNMLKHGFLLLNASLSWSDDKPVSWHAKNWYPFIHALLRRLLLQNPGIKVLLFGKIAEKFKDLPMQQCLVAEHPYVLSFIENPGVLAFFKPLHLLKQP